MDAPGRGSLEARGMDAAQCPLGSYYEGITHYDLTPDTILLVGSKPSGWEAISGNL